MEKNAIKAKIVALLKKFFPKFLKFMCQELEKNDYDLQKTRANLKSDIHKLVLDEIQKFLGDSIPEWYFWANLEEFEDEEIFGSSDINVLDYPKNQNEKVYEYNQLEFKEKYGSCLCTYYAPIGMLADNGWVLLNGKVREEWAEVRTQMDDFIIDKWGYISKGVDLVYQIWKNLGYGLEKFRFTKSSEAFNHLLENGWRLNIGLQGNSAYSRDSQDDWIVQNEISGKKSWGHSTTIRKIGDTEYQIVVIDSYKGIKKYNIYSFEDFSAFIHSPYVFNNVRAILPSLGLLLSNPENMETKKLFEDVTQSTPFYEAIAFMKERGYMNWYSDWTFKPDEKISRWEFSAVMKRIVEDFEEKLQNQG